MGWLTYYRLLKRYNGDLSKATKEEMDFAFKDNQNNSPDARDLAERKWRDSSKIIGEHASLKKWAKMKQKS